jgi:hypothetical protein
LWTNLISSPQYRNKENTSKENDENLNRERTQ